MPITQPGASSSLPTSRRVAWEIFAASMRWARQPEIRKSFGHGGVQKQNADFFRPHKRGSAEPVLFVAKAKAAVALRFDVDLRVVCLVEADEGIGQGAQVPVQPDGGHERWAAIGLKRGIARRRFFLVRKEVCDAVEGFGAGH